MLKAKKPVGRPRKQPAKSPTKSPVSIPRYTRSKSVSPARNEFPMALAGVSSSRSSARRSESFSGFVTPRSISKSPSPYRSPAKQRPKSPVRVSKWAWLPGF